MTEQFDARRSEPVHDRRRVTDHAASEGVIFRGAA